MFEGFKISQREIFNKKMQKQKKIFPDENELVICTVKQVQHHSIFAQLDEYNRVGLIHISEVSPGRIRNIRDYVKEGKVVVCKVLRVNKEKGYIDLSLRRVSEGQRRTKINEVKQEQKAEKIIEFVAKNLKLKKEDIIAKVKQAISGKFDTLYSCFEAIISEDADLEKLGVDKKIADELTKEVKARIKPPEVELFGIYHLTSYDPDGVSIIKDCVKKGESSGENTTIRYAGGGTYNVKVTHSNYKDAEKVLKKVNTAMEKFMKKHNSTFEFERIEA